MLRELLTHSLHCFEFVELTLNIEKSGTEGTMTRYTLYGARLKNDPYKRNTSQVHKDDAYAHFYMDANGKLVKWYMVKKF